MATGPFIDLHRACSNLGHILSICSPARSLHLELHNHSQHLFAAAKETPGAHDMKHLGLQSSCQGWEMQYQSS